MPLARYTEEVLLIVSRSGKLIYGVRTQCPKEPIEPPFRPTEFQQHSFQRQLRAQ